MNNANPINSLRVGEPKQAAPAPHPHWNLANAAYAMQDVTEQLHELLARITGGPMSERAEASDQPQLSLRDVLSGTPSMLEHCREEQLKVIGEINRALFAND